MRHRGLLLLVLPFLCLACNSPSPQAGDDAHRHSVGAEIEEAKIQAADGVSVFVDRYEGDKDDKRVVLMFHQAGSNAGEYVTIAPEVAKLGFDCIAIDQRSGGNKWERKNRTVAELGGQSTDYMDAYPDLVSALEWAKKQGYETVLAWGSSYSASLVFRLAAEHNDVDGILAFSPGEYFDEPGLVRNWNAEVKVPVLVASTKSEMSKHVAGILSSTPKSDSRVDKDELLVHEQGVHGSSTLIEDLSDAHEFYWNGVRAFLQRFTNKQKGIKV